MRLSLTDSWLTKTPIAHRGLYCHPQVPENSLRAFEAAMNLCMPVECDVHLMADGKAVVLHDHNLFRMTGRNMSVAHLDAQGAKQIRLLETKQHLPLLEEVLELIQGKVPLLIEIKNASVQVGALERTVLSILQRYKGEFALQSFNVGSLLWFRKYAPHLCRGQLSTGHMGVLLHQFTRPHFVAYDINFLPRRSTSRLRAAGVPLLAWTIRSRVQQVKAQRLADNYIFDQTSETLPILLGETEKIAPPFPSLQDS